MGRGARKNTPTNGARLHRLQSARCLCSAAAVYNVNLFLCLGHTMHMFTTFPIAWEPQRPLLNCTRMWNRSINAVVRVRVQHALRHSARVHPIAPETNSRASKLVDVNTFTVSHRILHRISIIRSPAKLYRGFAGERYANPIEIELHQCVVSGRAVPVLLLRKRPMVTSTKW